MDPLGRGLSVADAAGKLHRFDATGSAVRPAVAAARPLLHLACPSSSARLVAAADFGFVGAVDPFGRWLWQDMPVVHVGSIACSGDGQVVVAASYSEGVRRYDGSGRQLPLIPTPEPCRFAALTYSGGRLLAAGVFGGVHGLDMLGTILWEHRADQPVIGLGLTPFGDRAVVALADGRVTGLDLGRSLG
jgi:hypothetical protein